MIVSRGAHFKVLCLQLLFACYIFPNVSCAALEPKMEIKYKICENVVFRNCSLGLKIYLYGIILPSKSLYQCFSATNNVYQGIYNNTDIQVMVLISRSLSTSEIGNDILICLCNSLILKARSHIETQVNS